MKEMEALRRTVSKEKIQETVEILKIRTPRCIRFGSKESRSKQYGNSPSLNNQSRFPATKFKRNKI